jgi:integrase
MAVRPSPGIVERHSRSCRSRPKNGAGLCNCDPSLVAWVYDPRTRSKRYKTFTGKGARSAAKNWRSDTGSALRKGVLPTPTRQTVEQAARAWLASARAGEIRKPDGTPYKPSVLRQYEADLTNKLLPEIGHIRLSMLHRRDVQQLVVDRLLGAGLSGSRVRGALMPLRAICRRALQNDELAVNPTANLVLPAAEGVRERVASPEEAAVLLDLLPDDDRALWATAFYAGLRRGELRGLQCDDVDTEARLIYVRRGWDDVEGAIDPKSRKGTRVVPMGGELRRLLLEHMARTGRRGGDLVFGRTAREPFTPTWIRKRALRAWVSAALGAFLTGEPLPVEIDLIGLHECRHTYVSLMHAAGRSLEEIGDYVGHSSSYMTDRYRHLIEGQRAEAADAFDAFLAKRTGTQTGTQAPALAVVPHG